MAKQLQLRHPRLYAFYESTVLNSLFLSLVSTLLLSLIDQQLSILFIIICCISFVAGIVYTLWFWIKKPQVIKISRWLSDLSSSMTLYFLIYAAWSPESIWWIIIPAACGILAIVIELIRPRSVPFRIS